MGELVDIVLPRDELEGYTNKIGRWLKQVGDPVRKDEPLLEIITDKVTVELASPADGVLVEVLRQEEEEVEKGSVLGRIGAAVAAGPTSGRTAEFIPPWPAPRRQPPDPLRSTPS